jgi:lincosamide nucleotidyltransferase A/C/D/E
MTRDDVLDVLRRLDEARVEWWIDGGWGVDALLERETRLHDDLDLAVRREHVARVEAAFSEFTRTRDEWPASFVLVDARGRQIDVHPIEIDANGDGWQERPDGRRVIWPKEALAGRGRIGDRDVRCTSVEFQVKWHQYEGHDDIDRRDIDLLCDRFGLERPSAPWPGRIHQKRRSTTEPDRPFAGRP